MSSYDEVEFIMMSNDCLLFFIFTIWLVIEILILSKSCLLFLMFTFWFVIQILIISYLITK